MKIRLLLITFVFCLFPFSKSYGQLYKFSHTDKAYLELSGGGKVTLPGWTPGYYPVKTGMSFLFFGKSHDSLEINPNGIIRIEDKIIEAAGAHLTRHPYKPSNISHKLAGSAPNRIFIIEWKNAHFYSENSGNGHSYANFQVWLFENSGKVEIHYGPSSGAERLYFYLNGPICFLKHNAYFVNYMLEGPPSNPALIKTPNYFTHLDSFPQSGKTYRFEPGPNPEITITTKHLYSELRKGFSYDIVWINYRSQLTRIEYSFENGPWKLIADSIKSNTTSYRWLVQLNPTNNCRLRVSPMANPSIADSTDPFSIILPPASEISLYKPNGGETLTSGKNYEVLYSKSYVDGINIEYSTNGGINWTLIAENHLGWNYMWKVPHTQSSKCLIRLSEFGNPNVFDVSEKFFSIVYPPQPSITLLTPEENKILITGRSFYISWNSDSVDRVRIELSTDGGETWATQDEITNPPFMYYLWSVPQVISDNCRIKLTSVENPQIFSVSKRFFIKKPLFLTTPTGGEVWYAGTERFITWEATSEIQKISLVYSTNDGQSWNPISINHPAFPKYFLWNIPSISTNNCKIKIIDMENIAHWDISENSFRINFATGINKNQQDSGIRVYPNPSTGMINVSVPEPGNYRISIYSSIGKILNSKNEQFTGTSKSIDLKRYGQGLYLLEVDGSDKKMTRILITE